MAKEYVFAGFGGQGVLTAGMIFAEMVMETGKQVAFMPSYGAEMRGGSANCCIKVDDHRVGSPLIEEIDYLVTLNAPAIDSLETKMKAGGVLFVNSDIVPEDRQYRSDVTVIKVPCSRLAREANNPRALNLVVLGALLKQCQLMDLGSGVKAVTTYFQRQGKGSFNEANERALRQGYHFEG